MRKIIAIIFTLFAAFVIVGCTPAEKPIDLTGSWSGGVVDDENLKFSGEVEDDVLTIYLELEGTKGLYWVGDLPKEPKDGEKFVSKVTDADELSKSLYGSLSEEKEFVYSDNTILFEFQVMGLTMDAELSRE